MQYTLVQKRPNDVAMLSCIDSEAYGFAVTNT